MLTCRARAAYHIALPETLKDLLTLISYELLEGKAQFVMCL